MWLHEGSSRAIEAQWKGLVSSTVLRQATLECVVLARKHNITGWLADDRLLGPVRPVDLEWIAAEVLPPLVRVGLQRLARMEAIDPLNKLLIGQAQETAEQHLPFELRSFADLDAARAWACGYKGGATSWLGSARGATAGQDAGFAGLAGWDKRRLVPTLCRPTKATTPMARWYRERRRRLGTGWPRNVADG